MPDKLILNPSTDLHYQNVVVLDVILKNIQHLGGNFGFFPSVRDLTLRGDSNPLRANFANAQRLRPLSQHFSDLLFRLQRLALNLPLDADGLRYLIPFGSPYLEVLTLGGIRLYPNPDSEVFRDISLMPSLREFEIGVDTIADECLLFRSLIGEGEGDWNSNHSLKRIFLHFHPVHWLHTRHTTPAFTCSMYSKFRPRALRNVFFRIENSTEWDAVYEVLLTIESLEEVRLLFSLENRELVNHVPRRLLRDGPVKAKLSRLTIADNVSFNEAERLYYPFHEVCFDVLGCFPNVQRYELNTSYPVVAPTNAARQSVDRWKNNLNKSSSMSMNIKWYATPPYDALKLLRDTTTSLTIVAPGSCCEINLAMLVVCATMVKELTIISARTESISIGALPSLLDFPKLELFQIRSLRCRTKRNRRLETIKEIRSVLGSRTSSLREVRLWMHDNVEDTYHARYHENGRFTLFITPFGVREHCQSA